LETIKTVGRFLWLAVRPIPGWWGAATAVPVVAAAVLTALSWLTEHAAWGFVALLALFAYLFLLAGVRLQRYKDDSLHPGLEFGEPWKDICDVFNTQGSKVGHAALVGGSIVNDPPGHRPERAITEAFVTLEVLGTENGVRHRTETRWRESPQYVAKPSWEPMQRSKITLHPNDEPHPFDVVARPFGDAYAFVFPHVGLGVPPGKYTINVAVRGVGLDPNWQGMMELEVPESPDEQMRIAVVSPERN
jgi:hypothetical protein